MQGSIGRVGPRPGSELRNVWFYLFRKLIPTLALAGLAQAAWPLTGQCDGKEPV